MYVVCIRVCGLLVAVDIACVLATFGMGAVVFCVYIYGLGCRSHWTLATLIVARARRWCQPLGQVGSDCDKWRRWCMLM